MELKFHRQLLEEISEPCFPSLVQSTRSFTSEATCGPLTYQFGGVPETFH